MLARLADNADSLVRDLKLKVLTPYNKDLKEDDNRRIQVPTKDEVEPVTKQTYKVIDSDKMMADISSNSSNNPKLDDNGKKAINISITDYVCSPKALLWRISLTRIASQVTNYTNKVELSEKEKSSGVTHHRDIEAAQTVQSRIKTILPSGCS